MTSAGPQLEELYRLFNPQAPVPDHEVIAPTALPEPYRHLLVHPHHMTVTVEEYYHGPVSVRVLQRLQIGDIYARKIVLEHPSAGVVLFGVVRIHLHFCSEPVRAAILAEQTPLGRILIDHDVLRVIEPTAYLKLTTGPMLTQWFGLSQPTTTFGRLAYIHCDGLPAIELLEILAPVARR